MTKRRVRKTGKDKFGSITNLCSPGEAWSPRTTAPAIEDIEGGRHSYCVNWSDGDETMVRVVNGQTGKYLRTDRDTTNRNNLQDLPDC